MLEKRGSAGEKLVDVYIWLRGDFTDAFRLCGDSRAFGGFLAD